jgi:hypothetical protein
MARFATLALALVVAALAQSAVATDPCRNVVCPTRDEYFADNCDASCDVLRVVTKAKNTDGCCPVYKCVTNPDDPCCGRSCAADTIEEATEQCNDIFPGDPILTNLSVEAGAQFAVLLRPARPHKGKCCNRYECRTNAEILCANQVAKEPCENEAKCPKCFEASTVPADPASGRCCPEITCEADFACLCQGVNCPVPTCDPTLEFTVQLFEANPEEGRCCPTLSCQQNNTAICLAEQALSPERVNPTCSDSCQLPVLTREANFERLNCFPQFECIDDPSQPCCRVNTTTDCEPEPDCPNLFGICSVVETRLADPFNGQCCDRSRCVQNVTCICEQSVCETTLEYEARKCDPREEEVYIKREASPSEGQCCPKIRCRLTPEAKLRKLQKELKDQRKKNRRRRQTTTGAPDTTSTSSTAP